MSRGSCSVPREGRDKGKVYGVGFSCLSGRNVIDWSPARSTNDLRIIYLAGLVDKQLIIFVTETKGGLDFR